MPTSLTKTMNNQNTTMNNQDYNAGYQAAIKQACSHILKDYWGKESWIEACQDMFPKVTDEFLEEIHKQESSL